jgi:hypothetical protein
MVKLVPIRPEPLAPSHEPSSVQLRGGFELRPTKRSLHFASYSDFKRTRNRPKRNPEDQRR